jgi:hypothetical protein
MSSNYGFEPTLDGLNNIDSDSTTTTNIVCDTIIINTSGTAPTMAPGDNTTNIATTAFVNGAVTGTFVTLNTTQTITGEKTLSNANTFITGNTVTDSIQSSAVGTTQNIATAQTSGILNVGTLGARSGAININTGGTTTAGVNISTASTSFNTVSIGSASSAITMAGVSTFTNTTPSAFSFGLTSSKVNPSAVGGLLTIGDTQTTGILGIGGLPSRSGRIDINVGGTSTAPVNISSATNANAPITIGSTASTTQTATHNALSTFSKKASFQGNVNLDGTGIIETTTTNMGINVAAGNTITFAVGGSNTLQLSSGSNVFQGNCRVLSPAYLQLEGTATGYRMNYIDFDKYAYFQGYGGAYLGMQFLNTSGTQQLEITDTAITATTNMTTNGNLTLGKAAKISYTNAYSSTSITPVTTLLGGTLETSNSFGSSATGTWRYVMQSITPYDANGGLALTAGIYMYWIAANWEDGSAFAMTDCKLGLSNTNALGSGSSDATILAALPSLTCYFHKTDAGDAAASDSEQRVLSSCFRIASATTVYPFLFANHSVNVDLLTVEVIFTRIG